MIETVIGIAVAAGILLLVWWAVRKLHAAMSGPPIILTVVEVVLVLVFVLYVVRRLGLVSDL